MTSHAAAASFTLVEGSPQAAENPPHDAQWRLVIASAMRGRRPGVSEIGLDFELEPGRVRIDLDNMVRLALDGLRDAGVVARGLVGVERIVATKRPRTVPGLGISLAWNEVPDDDDPFDGGADLVAMSDAVPREESPFEKLAWRDAVAAQWGRPPVTKAVGVDIAVTKATSLAAMLKPIIDGLEPYLGQEKLGKGTLRPYDEQVSWLRISRAPGLTVGLRVRAGDAPQPGIGRAGPPIPSLPEMDPDFTWSTSDLEAIDRWRAWHRTFAPDTPLL
jgi:hypothetical protein